MKVVFVVPSDGFLPSGTVRVRQYLSRLAQDGVGTVVISYYSPVLDGFMARCRARGRGTIAIPAAQWLQAAYRPDLRARRHCAPEARLCGSDGSGANPRCTI